MSLYEIIVAGIAASNFVLTLAVMATNRNKAAAAKLDELGRKLEADLAEMDSRFDRRAVEHALRIERLDAEARRAPKHEDLGSIYDQLNATRQQVERLSGEMSGQLEQINTNMRLLLSQMMKTL